MTIPQTQYLTDIDACLALIGQEKSYAESIVRHEETKEIETWLLVEPFGDRLRITLKSGQGERHTTMFRNLVTMLGGDGDRESIVTGDLAKVLRGFRAANPFQGRRTNGGWKRSQFRCVMVSQRNDTRDIASGSVHGIGNADYSAATDSEFNGFESRLAMGNAEV